MSILSILAVAAGAPDDQSVIAIAADMARSHASTAIVINTFVNPASRLAPAFVGGTTLSPPVLRTLAGEQDAMRAEIAALVSSQATRFGLATSAGEAPAIYLAAPTATGWLGLMRELPLADVVVLGQSCASGAGPWTGPLGEALMDARVPVFVAKGDVSPAGRPAAVAWDGSPESARAVRAAVPLLKDASEVAILQDPDEIDVTPGSLADPARLGAYLSARGIAVGRTVETRGRKVGAALMDGALEIGAALLVAGAYGHSRVGEAIFGGATRAMLSAKDGPHLLISH